MLMNVHCSLCWKLFGNFSFFIFRLMNEFNESFKFNMAFTYYWARLTIWSSTTELVFQLVKYIVPSRTPNWPIMHFYCSFCLFLQIKSEQNSLLIEIGRTLMMVFWTTVCILAICELGEMIANQFESFNFDLCQSNWHLCSFKMRRFLMIFMLNAQQPTHIRTFGNQLCARSTFAMVRFSFLFSEFFFSIFCKSFFLSNRQQKWVSIILLWCEKLINEEELFILCKDKWRRFQEYFQRTIVLRKYHNSNSNQ